DETGARIYAGGAQMSLAQAYAVNSQRFTGGGDMVREERRRADLLVAAHREEMEKLRDQHLRLLADISLPVMLARFWGELDKAKNIIKPANMNVTIHRIEVQSDDPDRWVEGMVTAFRDAIKNPSAAVRAMREG